jgi:hypothetical protein
MTKENNDRCPNCGCLRIEEPTEAATADERTDWKQWGMDMRLFVDTLENSTARNQILALLSLAPDGDDKVGSESARRTLQSIADGLAHAAGEDTVCRGHEHPMCNYLAHCGHLCNKCGNLLPQICQPAAKASASK